VGSEEPAALLFPDDPALAPFAELDGALELVRMPNGLAEDASASASFVRRELRRLRPRVVHVTDVWPPGLVAARLAGVQRLLMTHHTPELPRTDNLAGRAWLAAGWLARPQVIYTSETDRRTDGRRLLHTHVVPLGIDLERFVRAPHEPDPVAPTIGNVARLATQKGQRTLIDAIPLVLTRYPGARFVVVGDGELREALVGQSERLGVTDHVTFAGERTDIPELLASFDVFAFPSLFEGLCLAVIEAQAAGVPVVATPVGGIRETVVPGETGLLVQPEDPAALARAVVELLDDPVGANTLAVEAQRRVLARFSESEMVGRTLELYGRPA
jgi:glycosyltransferase involved in cell wall biosynthesis